MQDVFRCNWCNSRINVYWTFDCHRDFSFCLDALQWRLSTVSGVFWCVVECGTPPAHVEHADARFRSLYYVTSSQHGTNGRCRGDWGGAKICSSAVTTKVLRTHVEHADARLQKMKPVFNMSLSRLVYCDSDVARLSQIASVMFWHWIRHAFHARFMVLR